MLQFTPTALAAFERECPHRLKAYKAVDRGDIDPSVCTITDRLNCPSKDSLTGLQPDVPVMRLSNS